MKFQQIRKAPEGPRALMLKTAWRASLFAELARTRKKEDFKKLLKGIFDELESQLFEMATKKEAQPRIGYQCWQEVTAGPGGEVCIRWCCESETGGAQCGPWMCSPIGGDPLGPDAFGRKPDLDLGKRLGPGWGGGDIDPKPETRPQA